MGNSFTPLKPSETRPGFAEVATFGEVAAGTDDERLVSPLKLAASYIGYYSVTRPYSVNQVVSHSGVLYKALVPTTGNTPPHADWGLMGGTLPVLPGNTTIVPAQTSGSGTQALPFVIPTTVTSSGALDVLVTTITVTNLTPGAYVPIADMNYATNGIRFRFTDNVVDGDGVLRFQVRFDDTPASPPASSFTLALKIGDATVYVNGVVSMLSISVPPATVSFLPVFSSGTGTIGDKYIVGAGSSVSGATGVVIGTYTVTGLPASSPIPTADLSAGANGGRYSFSNTNSNAGGTMVGNVIFNDIPASPNGSVYNLSLRFGDFAPMTYVSHARTINPSDALPGNASCVPAFSGGAGTAGTPFIIPAATSAVGSMNILVGTITITGFASNEVVTVVDQNSVANGGRYTFSGTTADVSGVLTLVVRIDDAPASADPTSYTLNAKIGAGVISTYVTHVHTKGNPKVITTPTITTPAVDGTNTSSPEGPFTTSAFAMTSGLDTHQNTDWQFASDAAFTVLVHQSLANAVAKTSYSPPAGALNYLTTYYVRARHRGVSGTVSSYSPVRTFTTMTEPGLTWTLRTDLTQQVWADVTYGAGLFVAVGYDAVANGRCISSSPDGITWTSRLVTAGSAGTFNGVNYGGGKFVAVGNGGMVSTSVDGITWTAPVSLSLQVLTDVVWNGTKYVIVGYGGEAFTSPDAVTWTLQNLGAVGTDIHAVTWNGTNFIGVGSSGNYRVSPDGIIWGSGTSSAYEFFDVIWDGVQHYACSEMNGLYTSPDGAAYTNHGALLGIQWNGLAYGASKAVVVGTSTQISTSPDGVNWTPRAINTPPDSFSHLMGVAFNGSKFVAVGQRLGATGWTVTSP